MTKPFLLANTFFTKFLFDGYVGHLEKLDFSSNSNSISVLLVWQIIFQRLLLIQSLGVRKCVTSRELRYLNTFHNVYISLAVFLMGFFHSFLYSFTTDYPEKLLMLIINKALLMWFCKAMPFDQLSSFLV